MWASVSHRDIIYGNSVLTQSIVWLVGDARESYNHYGWNGGFGSSGSLDKGRDSSRKGAVDAAGGRGEEETKRRSIAGGSVLVRPPRGQLQVGFGFALSLLFQHAFMSLR